MARADLPGGDETRQTRRHRGAGRDDRRRLLGARRSRREVREALRDDGELQLRPHGDAGVPSRAQGAASARSCTAKGATCTTCATSSSRNSGEGLWRRAWSQKLNGNLYPTHGLGPVANCMDINRGDRFDYLVSMSGPSRGLQNWAAEHFPADAPERKEKFVLGDVNVTLVKTAQRQNDLRRRTTRTCRVRIAGSISSRARKGSSRATRIASTSKDAASRTPGSRRANTSRSSTIRCGKTSPSAPPARATAAWTTWRITG